MRQLVPDTCALLALAEGQRMRGPTVAAIEAAQDAQVLFVPSFTALEVAQKMASGKLVLGKADARTWFAYAVRSFGLTEVEMSSRIALAAYELPEPFHRDPADRLIVAIARLLRAPVVTVDRRILDYGRRGHVATFAYCGPPASSQPQIVLDGEARVLEDSNRQPAADVGARVNRPVTAILRLPCRKAR